MIATTATQVRYSADLARVAMIVELSEGVAARGAEFAREFDALTVAWHAAPEGSAEAERIGLARRDVRARAFKVGYRLF